MRHASGVIGLSGAMWAVSALAANPSPQTSATSVEAVRQLLDCQTIAAPEARLACYDAGSATLRSAIARKDVLVVDRDEANKARRSLFGLSLPSLRLFGGDADGKDDREAFTELNATIASARRRPDGNWAFVLEDGAKWVQTDARDVARDPRAGMRLRIRAAAMGSFFANIDGQIGVRVRREN